MSLKYQRNDNKVETVIFHLNRKFGHKFKTNSAYINGIKYGECSIYCEICNRIDILYINYSENYYDADDLEDISYEVSGDQICCNEQIIKNIIE